jgi:hypothetical protein
MHTFECSCMEEQRWSQYTEMERAPRHLLVKVRCRTECTVLFLMYLLVHVILTYSMQYFKFMQYSQRIFRRKKKVV